MVDYLIFDISGILYRTFFANKNIDVETSTGLAHHVALVSMNKFYKKFKPKKKVVAAFDRSSWRKKFTASDQCLSKKPYKGNRRQNMTPSEQEKFARFMDHVVEFEEILQTHTSIICLAAEGLEADDLIAGFIEAYGEDGEDEIILISRDRDLAQMLGKGKDTFFPNVTQYDPVSGEQITIETAIKDLFKEKKKTSIPSELHTVDFFLFAKCLKGDLVDFVQAALPGIRKQRILKAYNEPFEQVNLMNESWMDQNKNQFTVKKLYEEGRTLMDLRYQPEEIRKKVFQTILAEVENPGKFNYFYFLRFLGKHQMKDLANNLETFIPLFSR